MNSILIVREAVRLARENGLRVGNADITIIAREPKVSPYVDAMKERLAEALCISTARVAVKATTNEGLDALGRGEGIAAHAVVLMTSHGGA
jgi:2-C-methyl-D-erythritol 2,4-cyclodiphosphate synthase